jgi:hypothetical protein
VAALVLVLAAACGGEVGAGAGGDAGGGGADAGGAPGAEQILAALTGCDQVSSGLYAVDDGEPETVPVCGLAGAVFWKSDLDVDCDGLETDACNLGTDPAFQADTSAHDSNDQPLDAAALPYVVVPVPSDRWAPSDSDLHIGAVVAVVHADRVEYAVWGDSGPAGIIGEASYAAAADLGIDPDPSTGGTDDEVAYVAFTGEGAVVDPIEDHAAAQALGQELAAALIQP